MKTIIAVVLFAMTWLSAAHAQSVCSGDPGLTIRRVAARTFDVCSPDLRYRFDDAGPSKIDPRYAGETQIRLRELWWHTSPSGSEVILLQCGQCDFLTNVSATGTAPQWAGGGHGYESGPLWSLALDGEVIAGQVDGRELGWLPVGGSTSGLAMTMSQTTIGYVAEGPAPVYEQSMTHSITVARYDFAVAVKALAYHAVHLDYAIMAQGVTTCGGGIWTDVELDGVHIVGPVPCGGTSNVTTNHGPGSTLSLVNSDGTVRLHFEASTSRAYRCVQRADSPHIKGYGRGPGWDNFNSPLFIAPGDRRAYQHSMRFVAP